MELGDNLILRHAFQTSRSRRCLGFSAVLLSGFRVFDREETPDELVSVEILEADRVLPGRYEIEVERG
jgi:hypothetical protein